jgi:hypothetical protein
MVTISAVEQRKNAKQETFPVLILTGELEIAKSKTTGKPYVTVRKVAIPCSFDEITAITMVGKQIPGVILKVPSEPYDYISKSTGEVISLHHTYQEGQQ